MPLLGWSVLAASLIPAASLAADDQTFGLGVVFGTDLPFTAQAELQLDLPGPFHLTFGGGEVPQSYRRGINSLGQRTEQWSELEGEMLEDDGKGSRVLAASFGYRPWRGRGLLVEMDATQVKLSATGIHKQMMHVFADGKVIRGRSGVDLEDVEARISITAIGARVGWEWRWGAVFARASLGGRMGLHSSVELAANWSDGEQTEVEAFDEEQRRKVEAHIVRNLRFPTIVLRVGADLF